MRNRPILLAFAVLAALAAPARAEPVSVYTDFGVTDACQEIEKNEVGGTWKCPGYGDYPVLFSEGDARESVFYGHLGSWYGDGAWVSFLPFNSVGEKIEWRLDRPGGTPFAAIQRWRTDRGDGGAKVDVLVVSKVGQPGAGEACVVGYVDATGNKEPNALARQVADTAVAGFKCRVDEAKWHGTKSRNAPAATADYGQPKPAQ